MHNTPEHNAAFRATWDETNARWKAQQRAYEADPEAYVRQYYLDKQKAQAAKADKLAAEQAAKAQQTKPEPKP